MQATRLCRGEIVKNLLKAGAEVNAQDNAGRTALRLAAESGQADIERILERAGAKQ